MAEQKLLVKREGDFHYPIYFEKDSHKYADICARYTYIKETKQKKGKHGKWQILHVYFS